MQDTCLLPSIHGPSDLNNGLALDQGRYARPWDAFCAMCEQVDPHPSSGRIASFIDVCQFATICNVTRASQVDNARKRLLTMYRNRALKKWKDSSPDYACEFETIINCQLLSSSDNSEAGGRHAASSQGGNE